LYDLDPESAEELTRLNDSQLASAVMRVRQDPSGRREPQHRFVEKFQNPRRYIKVAKGATIWEFKTNQWRALFERVEARGRDGKLHRRMFFFPVRGRRFWSMSECPWHR